MTVLFSWQEVPVNTRKKTPIDKETLPEKRSEARKEAKSPAFISRSNSTAKYERGTSFLHHAVARSEWAREIPEVGDRQRKPRDRVGSRGSPGNDERRREEAKTSRALLFSLSLP